MPKRERSPQLSQSSSKSSKSPPLKKIYHTENVISLLKKRETGKLSKNIKNFSQYKMFNDSILYNVVFSHKIRDILKYNPKIIFYLFYIDDNDNIKLEKYNNLCLNTNFYAQIELENGINKTFDLYGTNINDKNEKKLLDDVLLEHLYTDKKFKNLYLFNYTYNDYYDNIEKKTQENKETKLFNSFVVNNNVQLNNPSYSSEIFKDLDFFVKDITMNDTECKYNSSSDNDKYNSDWNNGSPNNNGGGINKTNKLNYIKKLKNKTLDKLQNIAKNKKIKYTKKLNGKNIPIKKETLIKKLCNYKFKTK